MIPEEIKESYQEGKQDERERILKIIDYTIEHNGILDEEWEKNTIHILNVIKKKISKKTPINWNCPKCNGIMIYSKDTKHLVCKCGFKKPSGSLE